MKPRALDLFCSAGGATKGLQRAGFHVTGIDIKPQPRYCGDAFIQADATRPPVDLRAFDFIWASPICQAHTLATLSQRLAGREYADFIPATRGLLQSSGVPFVIENVPGSPLLNPIMLCGSHFGLRLTRHRMFEVGFEWPFSLSEPCQHHENPVVVAGHGTPSWSRKKNGGKGYTLDERKQALGIDWMNRDEMSLSIPPAYAEFIGRTFLEAA